MFVSSLLLASCSREVITPLQDGAKLRQDCGRLLEQFPLGEIPKNQWPRSVLNLKPMRVAREQNDIQILIHQEPGKFSGGYYVYLDAQLSPSTQGVWIEKTEFKGIYVFKTQY